MPRRMLQGVINPRVKNKFGDAHDSGNYREIMSSSYFFKVFEYSILPLLKNYTNIFPQQFGYRPNTSTLLATTILKDTVNNFLKKDNSVYACFLDLSKAFERVDHVLLINNLLRDKVPTFIVNILRTVFSDSEVCVHFNGSFSNSWQVRQGVRQGGILSTYLFTYYIDDILKRVFKEDIGCRVGINKLNILAYADDIFLISPSVNSNHTFLLFSNSVNS